MIIILRLGGVFCHQFRQRLLDESSANEQKRATFGDVASVCCGTDLWIFSFLPNFFLLYILCDFYDKTGRATVRITTEAARLGTTTKAVAAGTREARPPTTSATDAETLATGRKTARCRILERHR